MSKLIELNLTLILFLPWLAVLSWGYMRFPKTPTHPKRRLYDGISLTLALTAFLAGMYGSMGLADPTQGRIWKHILAVAVSYGAFLIVLALAFAVRARLLLNTKPNLNQPPQRS